MNQYNTLSPKTILEAMSPTPWFCVDYAGYQILQRHTYYDADEGLLDEDKCPQAPINGHAAITAVNNTYGKGLNPEVYEEVVNALIDLNDWNKKWVVTKMERFQDAINANFELQPIKKKVLEALNKARIK